MKIDIIKPDGTVGKDGVSISGLSLSNAIFNDVWAIHWDSSTSKGYVEKTDLSVEDITDFTPYQSAITEYDAVYTSIPEATAEEKLRAERDLRLQATDWMALTDNTLPDAWKTYRQALRDLPANTSDFNNPTFPTEPT